MPDERIDVLLGANYTASGDLRQMEDDLNHVRAAFDALNAQVQSGQITAAEFISRGEKLIAVEVQVKKAIIDRTEALKAATQATSEGTTANDEHGRSLSAIGPAARLGRFGVQEL